jgi:plastocyanin
MRSTTAPPEHATNTIVRLEDIAIHPAKVTIQRGSTVTWQWLDGDIDTAHNVTSQPGGLQFKSSETKLTGTYSIRFDRPGKYFYECTIHPASMQGEIIVD